MKQSNKSVDSSRRRFLGQSAKGLLSTYLAMSFGWQISSALAADKTVGIFYASKYGATRDTANWIAAGLESTTTVVDINDKEGVNQALAKVDHIIIGSAIFQDSPMPNISEFINSYSTALGNKVITSFVVCGTEPNSEENQQRINSYLNKLNKQLLTPPAFSQQFGGRLQLKKLTKKDLKMLTIFYQQVLKKPLTSWDRTNPEQVTEFAKKIALHA